MDPNFRGDTDHHDGTSDATPGGYSKQRRPGELVFTFFLLGASVVLLIEAFGISGFGKLSAPGTVPVVTAAIMVVCMLIVGAQTVRLPKVAGETLARDILPWRVLAFVAFLMAYALAVRPLGFLPTTALFLVFGIRLLGRGWVFSAWGGAGRADLHLDCVSYCVHSSYACGHRARSGTCATDPQPVRGAR